MEKSPHLHLDYIKQYVVGIGPWKDTIVPPNSANYLGKPTDLVEIAHARGLEVLLSLSLSDFHTMCHKFYYIYASRSLQCYKSTSLFRPFQKRNKTKSLA